jgi:hypothetical protein
MYVFFINCLRDDLMFQQKKRRVISWYNSTRTNIYFVSNNTPDLMHTVFMYFNWQYVVPGRGATPNFGPAQNQSEDGWKTVSAKNTIDPTKMKLSKVVCFHGFLWNFSIHSLHSNTNEITIGMVFWWWCQICDLICWFGSSNGPPRL